MMFLLLGSALSSLRDSLSDGGCVPDELIFNTWQVTVKLVLKEWQFADGSKAVGNYTPSAVIHANQTSLGTQPSMSPYTGRKLRIYAIEAEIWLQWTGLVKATRT